MKALAKTIKLLTIFIFSVVLVLAASSFILQDKITALVVSALNKKVTSRVEADKVRLSFLRNFPNGSVELRNVLINSSVQPGAGNGPANDTLLFAESFFLEFRPFDVLRGIYNIKSIDLRDGKVKLFTDSVGRVNYEVTTSKNKTDETDPVNINLEKISLHRLSASYIDLKRALALSGEIKSGKLTSRISDRKATVISGFISMNSSILCSLVSPACPAG